MFRGGATTARFRLRKGIALIAGERGMTVAEETGRRVIVSPPAPEVLHLIGTGIADEDTLVSALENGHPLSSIYYALMTLEKDGLIVSDTEDAESPEDLFRDALSSPRGARSRQAAFPPLRIRVFSLGGADSSARTLARALARSEMLSVEEAERPQGAEPADDGLSVVVTPDYLEPELAAFGRLAWERKLSWVAVKPDGVIPWIGPLFVPRETGCSECLLDRVRGRRRWETEEIARKGAKESLRLSVGKSVHSLETVAGLLAVELEKLAAGSHPEMKDAVLTLDFRTLALVRHPLARRPQCPLCGAKPEEKTPAGIIPPEPLILHSRVKADYRDGGERVCTAAETLEGYAHLISQVTGVVGSLRVRHGVPSCFGALARSDWIVQGEGKAYETGRNGRLSATGISSGKGRTPLQARAAALGEAIERYSSQHEGYEPHVRATFRDLRGTAIHPYDLMGFSRRQYADREGWRQKGETAYVPEPYDDSRPIDWTLAWSISDERWRLVPSAYVYYSYPEEGGGDICRGCSNGVAAGNCLEEAVMQGFFEIVERDAAAIWWYHRLPRPAVDIAGFGSPFVTAVYKEMKEMGFDMAVLDLTHDLGIPVFAVNLFTSVDGFRLKSIGLGCHRDPRIALERAVSELGQMWGQGGVEGFRGAEPFLRPAPGIAPRVLSDFACHEHNDFREDIRDMVRLLKARGLEMLVVDLTRPDVGFPVARVIVPGMVHFWPRFGCRRLYEVPEALGWTDRKIGEEGLNPVPFCL